MKNVFVDHYKENKISPDGQTLDWEKYSKIRTKLYQQLGVLSSVFKDKDILEIGAGNGNNPLVTLSYSPKSYTILEPNDTAQEMMKELFKENNVDMSKVDIQNLFIEQYKEDKLFDIIIAEGFIPSLDTKYEILEKVDTLLKSGGIFITTTADEISLFFDISRRLLANLLVKDKDINFQEKIEIFVKAFESHLNTLEGMGRPKADWAADILMGDAMYQTSLDPSDLIEFYKNKFYYYNYSPSIIVDDTWFREVSLDIQKFNEKKKNNYLKVSHTLFHYKVFDGFREIQKNIELRNLCKKFISYTKQTQYEKYTPELKDNILKVLIEIKDNFQNENITILNALDDLLMLIQEDKFTIEEINQLKYFKSAFGRGQQYISFIKV